MNFELREQLDKLHDGINEFIDYVDEHVSGEDLYNEDEYTFLKDESGISNTELDNFLEILKHANDSIEKLK